jgi:hypothetical protein
MMGQDDPKKDEPEGDDPGTVFTEGDEGEYVGEIAKSTPAPEGEDPGQSETFGLEGGEDKRFGSAETRIDLSQS